MRTFRYGDGSPAWQGTVGTMGVPGQVRLCEHGRLWEFRRVAGEAVDLWEDLHPLWTPIRYLRARRTITGHL